jgi:hypothetical protein
MSSDVKLNTHKYFIFKKIKNVPPLGEYSVKDNLHWQSLYGKNICDSVPRFHLLLALATSGDTIQM